MTGRLPYPPLSEPLRSLVDWIARYTLAPKGSALAMVLRLPDEAAAAETVRVAVRITDKPPARPTPARTKVLAVAADGALRGKSALAKEAGVSLSVVDGLDRRRRPGGRRGGAGAGRAHGPIPISRERRSRPPRPRR